jgi:L-arabinose isomerase
MMPCREGSCSYPADVLALRLSAAARVAGMRIDQPTLEDYMSKPKIGLLGLYLKLYDDTEKFDRRKRIDAFYALIADELRKLGLEVHVAPICRISSEFQSAVAGFEDANVDALVTLHLAYSPSLESASILASTDLPIVVLDTTPTYAYGPEQNPEELMYNHGIHGVQDMCNLLIRNGKSFEIAAGHWEKSDILKQVFTFASAAKMAAIMRKARIGLIGRPFTGMGDFFVPPEELKSDLGITVVPLDAQLTRSIAATLTPVEIDAEISRDTEQFALGNIDPEVHRRSVRTGLTVRKWVEKEQLDGFSFNFLDVDAATGLETVPFLEASKLMTRGCGYAGEGDTLTAALVAAAAAVYPDTSFSEIFCPDWEHNRLYLSHMGEGNHLLFADKGTLVEMDYGYSDVPNPVLAAGRFKEGEFVIADLAPMGDGAYRLILAPARMTGTADVDNMKRSVHGWFTPGMPVADFLAEYSRRGGTHHLAVIYQADLALLQAFGRMMGFETVVI